MKYAADAEEREKFCSYKKLFEKQVSKRRQWTTTTMLIKRAVQPPTIRQIELSLGTQ